MRSTPRIFSASLTSMLLMRPFATVACTGSAWTMFGKLWSEEYFAVPLVFSGPSMRGTVVPIRFFAAVCAMVGLLALGLRRGGERAHDAALRQLDFEFVARLRLGIPQRRLSRRVKVRFGGGLPFKRAFRFMRAPRLGANAAECHSRFANRAALDLNHDRGRRKGEFIRRAVAQLQVVRLRARDRRRQRDVGDQVAGLQHV